MTRKNSRGQAAVIMVLMATAIFGFAALGVDWGSHAQAKRNFQNIADGAALAGAQDLDGSTPSQSSRRTGATDALTLIHSELGLQTGGVNGWATSALATSCGSSGTVCDVTVTSGAYTIDIHSPPLTATNTSLNRSQSISSQGQEYFEVNITTAASNGFGAIIGQGTTTVKAHAVAFHQPALAFGFALYTATTASSGNEAEIIDGNIYSYRNISAQSNGHASICANGGSVVLGSPQYPTALPSPDPAAGADQQHNVNPGPSVITIGAASCASLGSGEVGQTAASGCPTNVTGVTLDSNNSSVDSNYTKACVADSTQLQAPTLESPTIPSSQTTYTCSVGALNGSNHYQPGIYTCSSGPALTVDHPLDPGIYSISQSNTHGYDVSIGTALNNCGGGSAFNVCLSGVTFILNGGATMNVTSKMVVNQTPYSGPAGTNNPNDGRFSIYAGTGSAASLFVDKNGTTYEVQGTLYIPTGSVTVDTNAYLDVVGQAIVNSWNVQSGNHANPDITYDASRSAQMREVLRLVE